MGGVQGPTGERGERGVTGATGSTDWLKLWPIVVTLVGLIGAAFTLKADVDTVKEALGPAGSLPIIQYKLEQLGDRVGKIEDVLEKQEDHRDKMLDAIRAGQEKIDSLINLLIQERSESAPPRRLKPRLPPSSWLFDGLPTWS
jgi:hypothetical protein